MENLVINVCLLRENGAVTPHLLEPHQAEFEKAKIQVDVSVQCVPLVLKLGF